MSEHLKASELDICWQIGSYCLRVAGREVEITSESGAFWTFCRAPLLNHVVFNLDGCTKRIFIDPSAQTELFGELAAIGVTEIKADVPSAELLEQWWEIEMDDFDAELQFYQDSGELPFYES